MREKHQRALRLAECALARRILPRALALFTAAEHAGADADRCAGGRWLAHTLLGDYEAAWRESDAIQLRHPDAPDCFWRGEDLHGRRVMLRCLHGFGDAVQLLRFVPEIRRMAAALTVEVAPALMELATWIEGVEEVVTWGDHAPATPPPWDVQVEINELMYMLRVALDDVPRQRPYLRIPAERLDRFAPLPSSPESFKVGLVWAAGGWNPERSIPFTALAPILAVGGCEFWNLQGGEARRDWLEVDGPRFHPADPCAASTTALAGLVAQLDLVITCDTLAAHLAGAQNVPCWLLLQHAADWRWMQDRDDTPWYPSLRLFRRTPRETWPDLTQRVADVLRATRLRIRR